MPRYKVIATGFFEGKLYDPEGKRSVLHTAKPFTKKSNPMPSWLAEMPKESDGVKKKREALEAAQKVTDDEKADGDQKDIKDASFLGTGESGSNVQTL